MIGQRVKVTVDRPLGSCHPKYSEMIYPVNYGYVSGVLADDGEWQDAYILGVTEPITEFTGRVIAVIHRPDDTEDKWVVAPDGIQFTKDEIRAMTDFQEKYFNIEVEI